jgi:hypothetical protein
VATNIQAPVLAVGLGLSVLVAGGLFLGWLCRVRVGLDTRRGPTPRWNRI